MLDQQTNRKLTEVGAETPMGKLLRRYWHPIAAASELAPGAVKPLRILGESLVLYRDQSGTYGLLDRHCPHRGADLSLGTAEQCGLRCAYHGWVFAETGGCLEQPFEEAANPKSLFKDRVKAKAYPVTVKAGLIWAYFGPPPAPCLWDWDFFHDRGYQYVRYAQLPCNWLQCQENAIDPVHLEWLHENWSRRLRGESGNAPRHLEIDFNEIEYGFTYGRLREGTALGKQDPSWNVGRVCLWPNGFYNEGCSWRVPIDDENTLYILWDIAPLPGTRAFEQQSIPSWEVPLTAPTGEEWMEPSLQQDFAAMVGQGTVTDRTREHLGESDRGVILLRKRLLEELAVMEERDPKAVLRDESRNRRIQLPRMPRDPNVLMRGQAPDAVLRELDLLRAEYATAEYVTDRQS